MALIINIGKALCGIRKKVREGDDDRWSVK